VQDSGSPGQVLTAAQLEHEAKVRANWARVGMAVAGVLDGVAASQRRTLLSTLVSEMHPLRLAAMIRHWLMKPRARSVSKRE
jgi:hypothetical protein